MERKIEKFFQRWKEDKVRKPLLLFGLKQVGKTYTVLEFGRKNYKNIAYFNTLHNEELLKVLKKERSIARLVNVLADLADVPIEKNDTLIIFDNVEDEEIIKSIKLFGFDRNDYHVIAITSRRENLVKFISEELQYKFMTEMDFEEYLWARDEKELADLIRKSYQNKKACSKHAKIIDLFYDYLLTGGFPEVVKESFQNISRGYYESVKEKISEILRTFLTECDNLIDIPRGLEVLDSIPSQLEKENKKFQYGVLGYGRRAKEYENVIKYLVSNQLLYRSYKIRTKKCSSVSFRIRIHCCLCISGINDFHISFIYKSGYGSPCSSRSVPIKATGSPRSFFATIRCLTPVRACGTYSLIRSISASERK